MSEKSPELGNGIESKENIKPVYTALFVEDMQSLVAKFPPRHSKIFAHHSTIAFSPASLDGIDVGSRSQMKIIGRVQNEKGDALLVENPKSNNKYPHITLSCADGVPPHILTSLLKVPLPQIP